ncbi:MAG: hypothetical protein KDK64_06085 [Chlamydiia bacterium]|nr:hypothetical protein [Chlamydiia bacterium]
MSEVGNCPICFNRFENPYIHSGCGNTIDFACISEAVEKFQRCPVCNENVTMVDFKPNVELRDVLAQTAVEAVRVVKETPPLVFAPSVSRGEKGFEGAMATIKRLNGSLYNGHVNKEGTRKIRADWGNQVIAVFKSGKWRFYDLKKGGGALYEGEKFDAGVSALSQRV